MKGAGQHGFKNLVNRIALWYLGACCNYVQWVEEVCQVSRKAHVWLQCTCPVLWQPRSGSHLFSPRDVMFE